MGRLDLADEPDLRWEVANHMDAMRHSSLEIPEKLNKYMQLSG